MFSCYIFHLRLKIKLSIKQGQKDKEFSTGDHTFRAKILRKKSILFC